ncbi:hypothetical protein KsCSTR_15240 [Candidatus Kuenenia stuttgartiensis]|uniref:Uncharacterized protein n=1 Tax=Kuenenia stuttgartiensis TaxID=174633 RepID=Q1Q1I4_KUEST|nr:hypothetical protein KsCSTR_15240 [Candidatus Kuenenia stuttgartiensis]CAJ73877.1 unknown protein [Candidatus Kuenenia stuttgartiensis]
MNLSICEIARLRSRRSLCNLWFLFRISRLFGSGLYRLGLKLKIRFKTKNQR